MRKFAVYYDLREGRYHERCGSDSVAILDGRFGLPRLHAQAREIGVSRFNTRWPVAYRIARGERLSEPRFLTDFCRV